MVFFQHKDQSLSLWISLEGVSVLTAAAMVFGSYFLLVMLCLYAIMAAP